KKAKPGQLCGDISPDYLYYYQNAVPKILNEKDAQVPIIIVLRNPIDRAYSSYLHKIRDGREKLSFEDALNTEEERRADVGLGVVLRERWIVCRTGQGLYG
ncbi:MAG: hypothetical protein OXG88_11000, partial [Gammaproteobacteria bacterium]|nr:hypothetical protein [Gammaproteobacteria bacterium]